MSVCQLTQKSVLHEDYYEDFLLALLLWMMFVECQTQILGRYNGIVNEVYSNAKQASSRISSIFHGSHKYMDLLNLGVVGK